MPRSRFLTIASGMDEGQSGGAQELQLQVGASWQMSDANAKSQAKSVWHLLTLALFAWPFLWPASRRCQS